jgi:molybdopterin converting factor small subunit
MSSGDSGPVGGICYGLRAAQGEFAFVTSCDSAFLDARLISHLLMLRDSYDVVVPRWDDRLQPLLAVYRTTVLPLLEEQLAAGELRPVYLFDKVRTRCVEANEIREVDPEGRSFFNMNRPEDYAQALQLWSATQPTAVQPSVACTVELFGVARLIARTREVFVVVPPPATVASLLTALANAVPALTGAVIDRDSGCLVDGYACNLNGLQFVRTMSAAVQRGDRVAIFSADAGG